MANTGQNVELCWNKAVKILREDFVLRTYIKKVYEGLRKQIGASEIPAIVVDLRRITEEPLSEYPFIVRTRATFLIAGIIEIFDTEKGEWVGAIDGKGVGNVSQDIRKAFEGNLNLTANCDFFTFGETEIADEFPFRIVRIPMIVTLREEMRGRVRSA